MSTPTSPRIAVVMGGRSSEHEISLKSGQKVLASLADRHPIPVVIGRDGRWSVGGEPAATLGRALDLLLERADVAFLALHGPNGEDGTVQGLLETAGLPYTGSGVLGSALAMDKIRTKFVYRDRGIPTPDFEAVSPRRWREDRAGVLAAVKERLGYPCVFKPACSGSSVGVSFPAGEGALAQAIDEVLAGAGPSGEEVLVERYVRGREFTGGILAIDRQAKVLALPITEIIPDARYAYFDYEAKYTPGATREVTPAEVPAELSAKLQSLALAAHGWLGCRDFSRTDMLLDGGGGVWVLETNTIPGLTPQSLLPQAAEVAGYDFRALVDILVDNALLRRS